MSPLSHLKSVAALATRGGRGLPSRRNFSSSTVSKVANGFGELLIDCVCGVSKPVARLTAGYLIGYCLFNDMDIAERERRVKEEVEKVKREFQVKKELE